MSKEELELLADIVNFFHVGSIEKSEKNDRSSKNSNYHLTTSSGEYVVKIFQGFQQTRLSNEMRIIRALADSKVLTNVFLESSGGHLYERNGVFATISKKILGYHPSYPTSSQHCWYIGKMLAQFHIDIDSDLLIINNDFLFVGKPRQDERLKAIPDGGLKDELVELLTNVWSEELHRGLPAGILHGDLHASNVLIYKDRVAMLDFQSAGAGPYLLDIGRSMADLCNVEGRLGLDQARAYIQGYQSVRQLTDVEKKTLNRFIMIGAGYIALWAYQKGRDSMRDEFLRLARHMKCVDTMALFMS